MGGGGAGLEPGGGSRGASLGGRGMRANFLVLLPVSREITLAGGRAGKDKGECVIGMTAECSGFYFASIIPLPRTISTQD